jgi:hypothetical protein
MRRIGVLTGLADNPEIQAHMATFLQGLAQLGWTDGRNVRIDTRSAAGDADRSRRYAAEMVALAPDVILASGSSILAPLLRATRTVPIVFTHEAARGHQTSRRRCRGVAVGGERAANFEGISRRLLIFILGREREGAACLLSGRLASTRLSRRTERSIRLQMVRRRGDASANSRRRPGPRQSRCYCCSLHTWVSGCAYGHVSNSRRFRRSSATPSSRAAIRICAARRKHHRRQYSGHRT